MHLGPDGGLKNVTIIRIRIFAQSLWSLIYDVNNHSCSITNPGNCYFQAIAADTKRHACRMAEDERQIRAAAETLLSGSINSQRSSYTQPSITRTPDIILSEDLIAGAMQNGRMSNVRRFFCLFVTFDLLLTFLMWLICTMVKNIARYQRDQFQAARMKSSYRVYTNVRNLL